MNVRLAASAGAAAALLLVSCAGNGADRPGRDAAASRAPADASAIGAREAYAYLREKYDVDGDGRIAPSEYPRGPEAFARLDRDRDGFVGPADVVGDAPPPPSLGGPYLLVRAFGGPGADSVGAEQIEDGADLVDANGDGRLTSDELIPRVGPQGAQVLAAAVDADRDGALTLDEILAYVRTRDRDGDGRISRRERSAPGPEPKVGRFPPGAREPAPPFRLARADGGAPVALEDLRGRPVALIFGSFT